MLYGQVFKPAHHHHQLLLHPQRLRHKLLLQGSQRQTGLYVGLEPDGRQFVNVWVGGQDATDGGVSEAVELHEGESAQELKQRVEQATTRARQHLTQRAEAQEHTVTGGNIPYNDSTFLGGTDRDGPRPNRPAYRADISGPDVMVRNGTGTYSMHLHYEDVDSSLLGQVLEAYGGSAYTWQIIDITTLYEQVRSQRSAQISLQQQQLREGITPSAITPTAAEQQVDRIARRDLISQHRTVTRTDEVVRDYERMDADFSEDADTALHDLTHPLASSDGSSENAIRAVVVNSFNLQHFHYMQLCP